MPCPEKEDTRSSLSLALEYSIQTNITILMLSTGGRKNHLPFIYHFLHMDEVKSYLKIKCNVFSFVEVNFSPSVFNTNKSI